MMDKITRDYERFRRIVRGKVRKNLKEYLTKGALKGLQGKKKITIPLPSIDLPRFRHDSGHGGVASGDGEEGDIIWEEGEGTGEAGDRSGEHSIEVDVTIDELIDLMTEDMELPWIEEKGKKNITEEAYKYTSIAPAGPESLRHYKRTFKRALKRQISTGTYDPKDPVIIPVREDKRYRARKVYTLPVSNAVVIHMMDVSGSMGEEQKELVRTESFLIDSWLQKNYDGIDIRYITHDAQAREVDRHTFFNTRESGGTMISSAYKLCAKIIEKDYPVADWNIYVFHFSDGDNWNLEDTRSCLSVLESQLLPAVNMFGYGQVKSPYGSGEFFDYLEKIEDEKLILSPIDDMDEIFESIKDFFGKR